ncbi:hypothetical protein ACYFX5_25315 [Bremerella sp. T1]|nr:MULTISPECIES: hypothetical protein [Bremerella]WDI41019.1 hypothetical protein PSR63_21355 [Bremerella sp. P1]
MNHLVTGRGNVDHRGEYHKTSSAVEWRLQLQLFKLIIIASD